MWGRIFAIAVAGLIYTAALAEPAGAASTGASTAVVDPAPRPSPMFIGTVRTGAYHGDILYLGGDFTLATTGGKRFARQRLAAVDTRSGALLDWPPSADAIVTAMAVDDTGVYVAGAFATVNDQPRDSLAKLALATGTLDEHFPDTPSTAITLAHGRLYVAGNLSAIDGIARHNAAAFDGDVQALAELRGILYVGGHFDNICNTPNVGDGGICLDGATPRIKLAALDRDGLLQPWTGTATVSPVSTPSPGISPGRCCQPPARLPPSTARLDAAWRSSAAPVPRPPLCGAAG